MEGVGGFGVGGGFVGSGSLAGLGAAGCKAGAAGAGTGVVAGCSVKGPVEAVEDVGADLLAQVGWYDGGGCVVLVGAGLVG